MRITFPTISVVCAFLAVALVFPLARLDAALDVHQHPFLQILLRDFSQLSPQDDAVPLGALLAFAGAVLEGFVGREREVRHGLSAGREPRFWIAPEAPYEDRFVD